jgi:hypothetical protein
VHRGCKSEKELKLEADRVRWKESWRERKEREAIRLAEPFGRKVARPLDPSVDRPQPLLVVTKPLTLAETLHRYVASVLVECNGNVTAARRTLGISSQSLRRCIARIESGTVKKCEPVREMRDYWTGTK